MLFLLPGIRPQSHVINNKEQFTHIGFSMDPGEIFPERTKKEIARNKIAEIIYCTVTYPEYPPRNPLIIPDTLFVGYNKDGTKRYERTGNWIYYPDSTKLHGYDTVFFNKNCNSPFSCTCYSHKDYDSIFCNNKGMIQSYKSKMGSWRRWFMYNKKNQLFREVAVAIMPDGSQFNSVIYKYDSNNRIPQIDCYSVKYVAPGALKGADPDPFTDWKFSLLGKYMVTYDSQGRLLSLTGYYVDEKPAK
jgi:hypothetical protein